MTLETQIKEALAAQATTTNPPVGLAAEAVRRGRRTRRVRTSVAGSLIVLLGATGAVLVEQSGQGTDRLITPATQAPTPLTTPAPTASAEPDSVAGDAAVSAWLTGLPLGREPEVAWTYGLGFHSPDLNHTFPSGGWLVPLGRGGGGYVVELHSEGDTGAGDGDKRTGVLTSAGFRQIDHGNLTHGLSADGSVLASALWEGSTYDPPQGFDLFDTKTGHRRAHIDYAFDASDVVSVTPQEVRFAVFRAGEDAERLVEWDVVSGRVRDLGVKPESTRPAGQVRDRPFAFGKGVLSELFGAHRSLALHAPSSLVVMDVVRESADSVIASVAGQNTGDIGLIRCRFSTRSCERASALGLDSDGDFSLDASLR